jgi:integrase
LSREWYRLSDAAALIGMNPAVLQHVEIYRRLPGPRPDKQPGQFKRIHRDTVHGLMEHRAQGLSVSTSNGYLAALKRFTKWLVKNRRMAVDPLAHLDRLNEAVDARHQRRALKETDFARFVEATARAGKLWGLTGADRLVIYTLAANTGFRAKELGSLTPESFDLLTSPPTVTVEAAFSKRRRKDVQPLRPDVALMMRQYITGRPAGVVLWPGTWKANGAAIVRRDLLAAGIDYEDESGRVFDFHAMRGQFISFLAARGVHPKVAQILARHSTITLTMDYYTHLDVLDVAGALDKLPELPGVKPADARSGQGADKARQSKKDRKRA